MKERLDFVTMKGQNLTLLGNEVRVGEKAPDFETTTDDLSSVIKELRLLARAVFVIDKNGVIRYKQLVQEITSEPDYEAALKAAREYVSR